MEKKLRFRRICAEFVASSLSNLCNDLAEGIHRIKCKYGCDDKKCGTCGIKYKY